MKKSNFGSGYLVILRDGRRFAHFINWDNNGVDVLIGEDGDFISMGRYNEDLEHLTDSNLTIVQVWDAPGSSFFGDLFLPDRGGRFKVWDRPAKKMTLEEVIEELGYDIEIVDEHPDFNGC